MNNQNQKKEEFKNQKEIVVEYTIDDNKIRLTPSIVQRYLVDNVKITLPEFKLFSELCKVRKLNPFLREAYLIKYSDNSTAQMVVGKDAIIKRAVLNPNFNGIESGIIILDEVGEVTERKGTFKLNKEQLVGAWAKVYRKDWEYPLYASVSFDEVSGKTKDGKLNSNWATKGATMVEKVAKVRALREAFVEDLAGMYEAEEMNVDIPSENKIDNEIIEQDDDNVIEIDVAKGKEENLEQVKLDEL